MYIAELSPSTTIHCISRYTRNIENTLGLDGGEAMFLYVYIQITTMESPDLERTVEQVIPYAKSIA